MMDYGTGAIFGCPAHDERDFEFATKYGLPITVVVQPEDQKSSAPLFCRLHRSGTLINSGFLDGLSVEKARAKAIEEIERGQLGERKITYRLRDWCISRQRYWGCPIPVIYCESCGPVPVPDKDLPVTLPTDVVFGQGGNPLANHPTWKHVNCPQCDKAALRETKWSRVLSLNRPGTFCGIVILSQIRRLIKLQVRNGCRSIGILGVSSMQFCICFTRDFLPKHYEIVDT